MTATQELVDSSVDRAVGQFRENPLLSSRLLRRLAEEMPDLFRAAALRHLESETDSKASRLLTLLTMRQRGMFEFLTNPALSSLERAIRIVRRILAVDPAFDVVLARRLPDNDGANHGGAFTGLRAARILDILNEASSGRHLLPLLSHLVRSDDPKISARATMFFGRRSQSPEWAARQLAQTDQRVRANAIEAIWGVRSPAAISLLEECLRDSNNRVAGNALIGLHIAEAPGVPDIILSMARDPKPGFRSTAAWVMGRIPSPRFAPELSRLLKDESAMVRRTALRALIEVRRYESQAPEEIAASACTLPDEGIAERATAAMAEMAEAAPEPEPASVPIEVRLDGSSFASGKR